MPKLAVIIILYKPTLDNFQHLLLLQQNLNNLYVFDNTEEHCSFYKELKDFTNVQYLYDGQNKGIPLRLNQGCNMAIQDGCDWAMFLDQDSVFTQQSLAEYISRSFALHKEYPRAIFSAIYEKINIVQTNTKEDFNEVISMVTSTCLMPLNLFTIIGNFDENLFLDFTDFDYSIRIKLANIKQIGYNNIDVFHPIGQLVRRSSIKTLFLIKKNKSIHSPIRCYYLFRNFFYLKNKYKDNPNINVLFTRLEISTLSIKGFLLRNLYYGRNFIKYAYYIIKGYRDYKKKRFGKIEI